MPFVEAMMKVHWDNTGASEEMPVLLTPTGPFVPLIKYFKKKKKSLSWRRKVIRALRLFLEYTDANLDVTHWKHEHFANFDLTLRIGSFDLETKIDPANLCWKPMATPDANDVIRYLSDFFDDMGAQEGKKGARQFNPRQVGDRYDQMIDQRAWEYRKEKAFLGHLWCKNPETQRANDPHDTTGRATRPGRMSKTFARAPPRFPDARFEELLFKGFRVRGRYDWGSMLITTLLHGAGLRLSEPFHMFWEDVQCDPEDRSTALVVIHHPEEGYAPGKWKDPDTGRPGKRRHYLAHEFGLLPRNVMTDTRHAGWKNNMCDGPGYMQAHWLPSQYCDYGRLFLQLWERYLAQTCSIARGPHPFVWINTERNVGDICTLKMFVRKYGAAIKRIGMIPSKAGGTSPHGGRHAYGKRAEQLGMSTKIIQHLMHHGSPLSQEVYTQADLDEVRKALAEAQQRAGAMATVHGHLGASLPIEEFIKE
jgi:integrase